MTGILGKAPFWLDPDDADIRFPDVELALAEPDGLLAIGGDLSKERTNYSSVLGGGGVSYPISRNASFFAALLYNFSYDDNEIPRPYSSPWIFRTGVGFSF